jgi:general secretion pathway protein D
VYWTAPTTPGSVTITLSIGSASKSQTVTVGASVVSMDVSDAAGGKKVATVKVNGVTDLYQAAFRVQYTSAWKPESVTIGSFLGASSDVLSVSKTDQAGFVPVSITRKGNVAGVDGSGTLATITFAPNSGTSSMRELSSVPFDISGITLVDSHQQPISNAPAP